MWHLRHEEQESCFKLDTQNTPGSSACSGVYMHERVYVSFVRLHGILTSPQTLESRLQLTRQAKMRRNSKTQTSPEAEKMRQYLEATSTHSTKQPGTTGIALQLKNISRIPTKSECDACSLYCRSPDTTRNLLVTSRPSRRTLLERA